MCNCCQTHFFKNGFSFWASFWALVFQFGECSRFISNNSIWWPQGAFMAPPGGGLRAGVESGFALKKNGFCMFSLKIDKNSFGFQCSILVANVADSYQITLFGRRHCSARGVARGLPKKAFEESKIACWASGAPLGSQAAPGDLFWIPLVASLALEAFWGPFWLLLGSLGCIWGSFLVFFKAFRYLTGYFFLKFRST